MKFRKKPVVIDAQVFTSNVESDFHWTCKGLGLEPSAVNAYISPAGNSLTFIDGEFKIHTLEGVHTVSPNDMVIIGVKGEAYPCKPDIFAVTYEPVEQ